MNKFVLKQLSFVRHFYKEVNLTGLLLIAFICASAQTHITGIVRDTQSKPIPGVNIQVKGNQKNYTISDDEGRFQIETLSKSAELIFSYVGFESKTIQVSGDSKLTVELELSKNSLDQVVVIGYGTSTREKLTGSVARVSATEIANQPVANPISAIQGRMAGVVVTSGRGVPGSNISVQVRGTNTIASGSYPLYLINGVPVPYEPGNQIFGANGPISTGGGISPLNTINPADIESIEVLKDADATAIYGSRGANGVVLITTKKGKAGQTKVSADVYTGGSAVTRKLDVLNTEEYLNIRREAFAKDGITPTAANAPDLLLWDKNHYSNWQEKLIGNSAPVTNAQATFSGGNENTQFLIGGSFRKEGAVLIGNNSDKRGNAHFNIQHSTADKKFSISATATYGNDMLTTAGFDPYPYLLMAPNMPMYDASGKNPYYWSTATNPISYEFIELKTKTTNLVANSTLNYKIIDGLNIKADLSYTQMNMRQVQKQFSPANNPFFNYTYTNEAYYGNSDDNTYVVEPQINYSKKFGKHGFSALIGSTFQGSTRNTNLINGQNYSSDALLGSLAAATTIISRSTQYNEYKYQSVFGRLSYDFEDKYLLNATFRRDGSSRFGEGKRYGNFGAVGAAWIFSKEDFVKEALPFLSFGKLRSSYGITGNDQIGNYRYLETYTTTLYPYTGASGLFPNKLPNPDYSWEENKKFEAALELGFLNNRILANAAFFSNRSGNQLVDYPLPSQTGFAFYQANLDALIQNRGWEFELTTKNFDKSDFRWNTTFNITFAKNTLLRFPGLSSSSYANKYEIGQSINVFRLYHFQGINPANGLAIFEDRNGDGAFTPGSDYQAAGDSDPKFYGGLGNTFSYKGFDLDIFFQFQRKPKEYGYLYLYASPVGTMNNVSKDFAQGYWTTPGQQAERPGLTSTVGTAAYQNYNTYYTSSDAILSNASYIRLKNISLTYTFPQQLTKHLKIERLQLYAQAQNLFTITNYNGLDPETPRTVPPLKTIVGGLRVTL